jgi:hypothetical protein
MKQSAHRGEYPANWNEIATEVKERNHWICEACKACSDASVMGAK